MSTIDQLLKHRANFSPELEALVGGGMRYTYKEYNQRVNQLAHYLMEQNVQKGDRIGILCKNNHPLPTIFMAAIKIGAIVVPMNWRLTSNELEYIVQNCQPRILFYDEEFAELVSVIKESSVFCSFVRVGVGINTHPSFEGLLLNRPMNEPNVSIDENDTAVIIYTSGTTGNPKGVMLSHYNLYTSIVGTANAVEFNFADRYLAVTPLFHVSGTIVILSSILQGMTMVFMPEFDPIKIWDVIDKEKITTLMTVPPILIYMLPELMRSDKEHSSLKSFICGGTHVPAKLIRQYNAFGFPITQVYGCTEGSGAFCFWTSRMGLDTCDSVGKTIWQGEVKIIHPETGQELPPGEVGEIVFKGPQSFKGYWNNNKATQEVYRNGWLRTGDAGKLDQDGFLYVMDRYKDMIICGGENIYPAQVEEVIQQIDGVLEVALIGIPDQIWGEIPRAYIVAKPGANITQEDILSHCSGKIANYKLTEVVLVDSLPKNSFGKVLKRVMREQAIKEL